VPIYDLVCENGHRHLDQFLKLGERPPCRDCGASTDTLWEGRGNAVSQDSIEGGVLIHHGLCYPDGTPRRFYSKSEIARAAAEKGLKQVVEHKTTRHTDKSPHTSRWF
jgi:hypothetical protein